MQLNKWKLNLCRKYKWYCYSSKPNNNLQSKRQEYTNANSFLKSKMVLSWQQQLRIENIRITFAFLRLVVYSISHYHVTTNNTERSSLLEVRSRQVMRAFNTRKYMLRFWNFHAFIQMTVGTVRLLLYFSGLNSHVTLGYIDYIAREMQQLAEDSFRLDLLPISGSAPKITLEVIQEYVLQRGSHFCHLNMHAYIRNKPCSRCSLAPLMCISLTRTVYNAIDEEGKAVCITQTFVYACWLLRDFRDRYEDERLDDGPNFFLTWPYSYYAVFCNVRSHKNATTALYQN